MIINCYLIILRVLQCGQKKKSIIKDYDDNGLCSLLEFLFLSDNSFTF